MASEAKDSRVDSKGEIISRVGRGPAKGGMHAGEVLYYFLVD